MTLNELVKIVNGETVIDSKEIINEIKTDTRKINKGDIFIALKGNKYDGHNYIDEAIQKGSIACIVEDDIDCDKCIKVKDTYKCLFDIGKCLKEKYNIPLIAITGSNGKTTTKELIVYILKSKYNVLYNKDSKNNLIGVSDTLFKLNSNYDVIVMEFGTNHIGEIKELSSMCTPNTSIITNIGTSHIGYFKNKKNIFKEKVSIGNNNLIVCGDDKYLKRLVAYKCGLNKNNDLIAYNIEEGIDYITFNIYIDKEYKIKFNNPGKHFISDILLAIKGCLDYKIDIDTIIDRISSFKLINKRMTILKSNNNIIINDCYNASLESIKSGIEYMKNIKDNKIFIIGDVLELGKYSKKIHKKINKLLKGEYVYTVGNYSRYIKGNHFDNVEQLIDYLNEHKIENTYIFIKGSRRMNLDKVVEYLKK